MATACCSVAMAEVTCGGGGGGKRPTRGPSSACCTISRSYLTISWMMAFSWLLNTPELRSRCTLWNRIEFFLPGGRTGASAGPLLGLSRAGRGRGELLGVRRDTRGRQPHPCTAGRQECAVYRAWYPAPAAYSKTFFIYCEHTWSTSCIQPAGAGHLYIPLRVPAPALYRRCAQTTSCMPP